MGVNKFIPVRTDVSGWIDCALINKKKIAWNRYWRRKTTQRYEHYCKIRNNVITKIREAKEKFEKPISNEAKRNPQAIFDYMRSKVKIREEVTGLKKDVGSFTNNDKANCKLLNDKFQSVFVTELEGQLPKLDYVFAGEPLLDAEFDIDEVKYLLKNLKKTTLLLVIFHVKYLKNVVDHLLTLYINC